MSHILANCVLRRASLVVLGFFRRRTIILDRLPPDRFLLRRRKFSSKRFADIVNYIRSTKSFLF